MTDSELIDELREQVRLLQEEVRRLGSLAREFGECPSCGLPLNGSECDICDGEGKP